MQISSRFTIAIHVLTAIDMFQNDYKITSSFLAASVNVNPVIIRKVMQQLKAAGLIAVRRGSGGMTITRPLPDITFLDIFRAVDCIEAGRLFHFHENPNALCPVGRNIHAGLDDKLSSIQTAMEEAMKNLTIADVVRDTQQKIAAEH